MAMTEIIVNPLNQSSIKKAIKELQEYKKLLKEFPNKYVRALSEHLYDTLNDEAPQMFNHWILDILSGRYDEHHQQFQLSILL